MKAKGILAATFFVLLFLSGRAYGGTNTFLGDYTGLDCNTCDYDTFIGIGAGWNNVSTSHNVYVGDYVSGATTCPGFVQGNENTAVGTEANICGGGGNNTFVGGGSGRNNNGNHNTYLGYHAGYGGTNFLTPVTSTYNTYVGDDAGHYTISGTNNTALGHAAGLSNSDGNYNTFIGDSAGYYNYGWENTIIGSFAGQNNSTGDANVFIGYMAGSAETGSQKLYIDNCYLTDGSGNCTRPLIKGTFDNPRTVSIDGTLSAGAITTTGSLSAGTVTTTSGGIQFPDGSSQTKGLTGLSNGNNSFFGNNAGRITTGISNTFVGNNAGYSNTGGYSNTFFGYNAGYSNTVGYSNSFFGFGAGYSNTGDSNSFFGNGAGNNNTSGHNNTFIGVTSGFQNTSGSGNVFLGYYAGYSETGSNKLYIDNCFTGGNCDLPLIKGDFAGRTVEINGMLTMASIVSPSDMRLKKNIQPLKSSLDKVMHLQGVSYEWRVEENPGRGFTGNREIGLIAQDVEGIIPELVRTDSEGYKALAYDKMVPVLVEAVKEQQKQIRERDARIERLEKALEHMERRVASLDNLAKMLAIK